jgi:hypothetical protein
MEPAKIVVSKKLRMRYLVINPPCTSPAWIACGRASSDPRLFWQFDGIPALPSARSRFPCPFSSPRIGGPGNLVARLQLGTRLERRLDDRGPTQCALNKDAQGLECVHDKPRRPNGIRDFVSGAT